MIVSTKRGRKKEMFVKDEFRPTSKKKAKTNHRKNARNFQFVLIGGLSSASSCAGVVGFAVPYDF